MSAVRDSVQAPEASQRLIETFERVIAAKDKLIQAQQEIIERLTAKEGSPVIQRQGKVVHVNFKR